MQPVQLELGGRAHRNRRLFSDHYLDAILPGRPDWRLEEGEAARVNDAYGLTDEEVALLWATTPLRMPVGAPGGVASRDDVLPDW